MSRVEVGYPGETGMTYPHPVETGVTMSLLGLLELPNSPRSAERSPGEDGPDEPSPASRPCFLPVLNTHSAHTNAQDKG